MAFILTQDRQKRAKIQEATAVLNELNREAEKQHNKMSLSMIQDRHRLEKEYEMMDQPLAPRGGARVRRQSDIDMSLNNLPM